ncbi:MAG: Conjugative transfer protein TrbL [uncultured Nocardioides sp.]|uniref:Conjugative transfer protein TrbL n=1 Tax=uncultured Nocardioides sp. TaxID=198441 RepID=A0A6J4NZ09_9ACTN|nr:MAG: Conjugative transfer protein TrbL [uncultured Nocardioides sp.]
MPEAVSQLPSSGSAATIAISVHGPAGVLDLVVPIGATPVDVGRAYAEQSGLSGIPLLQTPLGEHLRADLGLGEIGVESGTVLVAATGVLRPRSTDDAAAHQRDAGDSPQVAAVALALAVGAAALSAWYAAQSGSDGLRTLTVGLLLACALAGSLPWGRHAQQRTAAAPGLAGAAAFAAFFEPGKHLLGAVVAVCALAAALTAAISRALGPDRHQVQTVWIVAGSLVFGVCALSPLMEWDDRVSWALLVVLAMLAARFVPSLAVDVPDEALLDLERLAVTAWSARDRTHGRRGRVVIPESAMRRLVEDAGRTVTASCAAILLVTLVAVPLLLASANIDLDRIGARCLVLLAGAAIVLAARQYRHAAARRLLRAAGLACWAWLVVFEVGDLSSTWLVWGLVVLLVLGAVSVAAAVATGRGWRSVWWSRKAEVAEGLAGAFAFAATVVASGLFRALWEMTS